MAEAVFKTEIDPDTIKCRACQSEWPDNGAY